MTNAERQKRYRAKQREERTGLAARFPNIHGYLYLIHCIGFPYYKIGATTRTPQARLKDLQTGLPFELELEYAVQLPDIYQEEYLLHEVYKDVQIRGEWFNLTPSELEYLKGELVTIRHGYAWEALPYTPTEDLPEPEPPSCSDCIYCGACQATHGRGEVCADYRDAGLKANRVSIPGDWDHG